MEEVSSSSLSFADRTVKIASIVEAMAVDTIVAAGKSLLCLLLSTGSLLTDPNNSELPNLTTMDGRFPFDELSKGKHAYLKNKDASDEDEDEEDDDDANDPDDEEGDEDFSGEEGEEEGDPEDDPGANGAGGSDGDDDGDEDDDDDGEDEDEEDDGEDEEEEDDDEEVPQPPAKKRK